LFTYSLREILLEAFISNTHGATVISESGHNFLNNIRIILDNLLDSHFVMFLILIIFLYCYYLIYHVVIIFVLLSFSVLLLHFFNLNT